MNEKVHPREIVEFKITAFKKASQTAGK